MEISEVYPKGGVPQSNYCGQCGGNLDLAYTDFHETVSGIEFVIDGLPVLRCHVCSKDHLPDRSRLFIIEKHEECVKNGVSRFASRRRKIEKSFGFTAVPFLYDPDDYFYIPGLTRPWNEGFLTPVFFNRRVLLKYDNAPGYRVRFASTTYGDIDTEDHSIAFGINRHGNLVMWLGDIAKLPESEQFYLRSENINSDHSVGSEFYDGQIECKFTARPREDELFKARSLFVDSCFVRFKLKVAHLDTEVIDLALAFNPPVVDTEKERRHVADTLNKLYLESFDNDALGKILASLGGTPKQLGSLKRLQGVLERTLPNQDVAGMLSPFYVLYDLRVAYSHLQSNETATDILEKVTNRLSLEKGSGLLAIYDELINRMTANFVKLAEMVSSTTATP